MAKAATATSASRVASLQLEKLVGRQTLNVRVPRDIGANDFTRLGKSIIDVVRSHTGCNCLSGVIDVVLKDELRDAINVELG
jgi:hypothetical protein